MDYFTALAVGVPVVAIAAFGCALGQAKVVSSAVESMARQPSAAPKIQLAMIIGIAFIESLAIYSLMMSFMLFGKLPSSDAVLEIFRQNHFQGEALSSAGSVFHSYADNTIPPLGNFLVHMESVKSLYQGIL